MASQDAGLSKFKADFKRRQDEMTNKIDAVLKAITDQIAGTLPSDTVKNLKLGTYPVSSTRSYLTMDPQCSTQLEERNLRSINSNPRTQTDQSASIATEKVQKLNSMLESLGLVPQCSNTKFVCSKEGDDEVMFIEIIRDDGETQNKNPNVGEEETAKELVAEYFDIFPTKDELTYHRLETTVPQKEETFQVAIDLVKNSLYFKASTISADVLKIFMQQFWYSIKKVQGMDSYEFFLSNKKCVVNANVFRTILDICPKVKGVNFTAVPDDDTTLAFLIKLGYKGLLYKHTNMFVDHMHQPWRTLAAIINKCPSGKTTSNDKLQAIKQSKSYQMFIKYSTGQIRPKKSRGKVKRKTSSKRRVKKKFMLSANDNIIFDDPDTALVLGKSISQIEAEEAKAARQVHDTHAKIMIESIPKPTRRRKSGKVTSDPPKKLKGVPSLTLEEQEATDIMQALKKSKKTSKRQPGTRGLSEGTSTKPGVLDESTVVSTTSSEGTGTKPGILDAKKEITKENVILEWGSEQESEHSKEDKLDDEEKDEKEGDAADENDETKYDEDDIYKYKIPKADAKKTSEIKDDPKKIELPPTRFSLSASSAIVTTLPSLFVSATPSVPQQTTTPIPTPTITTDAPTVTTAISESDALFVVQLRVAKLEKYVSDLKKIDLSAEALAALKTQAPFVVDNYLGSIVGDVFKKELKKHTTDLIQKYSLQQIPELPKKPTPTIDLEQGSEKSASEILEIKREQVEKQQKPKFTIKYIDQQISKTLIEDENAMDKGVADTVIDHKRKHDDDDDEDPPAGPNQDKQTKRKQTKKSESSKKPSSTKETSKGKAPTKGSKTGESASAKEPVEEPIAEVVMDNVGDDVARDDNQPQDTSKPKTRKTLNPEWFKQPPRPFTPDSEWNKRQKNTERDRYPFDLSKPLPLQGLTGHRTVAVDYFFNNDLEYMKTSDPEVTYTTFITKTKVDQYEIKGIKDVVPTPWSTIKHAYEKDVEKGIKHWGERRKLWNRSQVRKFSKHTVYSTKEILDVKSVSIKKLHGYGHLEEIVLKISDQHLYKFKEGDFVDLHLNDIEDMLLLAFRHKILHLDGSDIVDFIVALRMFTRSLILKRRVEDLQLGVESYQKKLNITKPQKTFLEIKFKEPYTPSYDPPGIVYKDLNKQKRVLRAHELYKFSDGTLKFIRDEIHHRVLDFRLDYNTEMLTSKWTAIDRKRSGLMIELIDKQLREREIFRNLERLVGARELEMD
nr:hypothetical protein [Tanacetum cinerariifolium]